MTTASMRFAVFVSLIFSTLQWRTISGFTASKLSLANNVQRSLATTTTTTTLQQQQEQEQEQQAPPPPQQPAPVLNGKRVLPFKVMSNGLKGFSDIAAVYAVLNSNYKRGSEGWDCCEIVSVSKDLETTLQKHLEEFGKEKVAHIRALSFSFPQETAMKEVASQWRSLVEEAGGQLLEIEEEKIASVVTDVISPEDYLYDDDYDSDDEDDDFDDEDDESSTVVSPFDEAKSEEKGAKTTASDGTLEFTRDNVDKVLDEVRPYLISDGGNISVEDVDAEKRNIILKLEGACGSCPSSTVTMQMGVERVLKENFENINEVIAISDDDGEDKPTELTMEAVEQEMDRLRPAMLAMGAVVRIVSVNPYLGVVKVEFRGSNKVRSGLEMALMDVEFVKHVQFVMPE